MALIDLQQPRIVNHDSTPKKSCFKTSARANSFVILLFSLGVSADKIAHTSFNTTDYLPGVTYSMAAPLAFMGLFYASLDFSVSKQNREIHQIIDYLNGEDSKINLKQGNTPDTTATYTFPDLESHIQNLLVGQCNALKNKNSLLADNKEALQCLLADALLTLRISQDNPKDNITDLLENKRILTQLLNHIALTPEFIDRHQVKKYRDRPEEATSLSQALQENLPIIKQYFDLTTQNKIQHILNTLSTDIVAERHHDNQNRWSCNPFSICFRSRQQKNESQTALIEVTSDEQQAQKEPMLGAQFR